MRPVRIEMEGFLSYRDRTIVDLSDVGAAAILGPNGSGKTSLIEAMTWALFGEGRGRGPDEMVNPEAMRAVATLTFDLEGRTYRVGRERTVGKTPRSALILEVYDLLGEHEDGEQEFGWRSLGHPNIVDTQAAIEELLGMSFQTWEATSYIGQGRADAFTRLRPADRKRLLGEVLELERYALLSAAARETGRSLSGRSEELRRRMEGLQEVAVRKDEVRLGLEQSAERRDSWADAVRHRQKAAEEATAASVRAEERVSRAREGLQRVGTVQGRLRALQAEVDGLGLEDGRLEEIVASLPEVLAEMTATTETLQKLEAEADALAGREADARGAIVRLETEIMALQGRLAEETERLRLLDHADSVCPTCGAALEDDVRAAIVDDVHHAIDTLTADATSASQVLGVRRSTLAVLTRDRRRLENVAAVATEDGRKAERQAQEAKVAADRLVEHRARRAALEPTLRELVEEIESLGEVPSVETAEAEAVGARTEAKVARGVLQEALEWLQEHGRELGRLSERMAQIEQAEAELSAVRQDRIRVDRDLLVLGLLERAFGRDGIPALLIETAIPEIEGHANELLELLTGGRLQVSLQTLGVKKTGGMRETLDIVVGDDVSERPLEALSGGERQMVDLALRIALSRLLAGRAGRKIEALILDEPFVALDEEHRQRTIEAFAGLSRAFPMMLVVTHLRDLAEAFQTRIVVERTGGSSSVRREG